MERRACTRFLPEVSSDEAQQIQQIKMIVFEVAEGNIYTLEVNRRDYIQRDRMNNFKWFSLPISKYRFLVLTSSLGLITYTTVPTKKCHQDFYTTGTHPLAWLLPSLQWFSCKIMNINKHFLLLIWVNINVTIMSNNLSHPHDSLEIVLKA